MTCTRSRLDRRAAAAAALAIVLVAPLALAAPSAVDEAKAHFKTGTELYDENNFRGALVEFQRAYDLSPSYKILFNIGQVDMELQDYAGALTAYARYLREGGPDVSSDRVAQVSSEVERLKARVGHITVQTAPGAEVALDNLAVGFAPLPDSLTVNTGRHTVTVRAAGHPEQSRVIDVAGQQQLTVALGMENPASSPAVRAAVTHPDGAPHRPKTWPTVVAWSATGVFAAGAAGFGILAISDSHKLSDLRGTFPVTKATLDSQVSKEKRDSALADGFGAAAILAGGIGLYLTLTHHGNTETDRTVVLVGPTGAAISGHF